MFQPCATPVVRPLVASDRVILLLRSKSFATTVATLFSQLVARPALFCLAAFFHFLVQLVRIDYGEVNLRFVDRFVFLVDTNVKLRASLRGRLWLAGLFVRSASEIRRTLACSQIRSQ
jgi:hypothetical protein